MPGLCVTRNKEKGQIVIRTDGRPRTVLVSVESNRPVRVRVHAAPEVLIHRAELLEEEEARVE